MRDAHTILVKSVPKIIDAAAQRGVKAEDLYRSVSLDPSVLNDPDNRIPFAQVVALYQEAARLANDQDFGLHIGEASHPRLWDVLGYSFMNSATLGEAFNRLIRYLRVWTDGASHDLEIGRSVVRIEYRYHTSDYAPDARRQDCEKTFSVIVGAGRLVTGVDWSPTEVSFQHREPESVSEHHRIFRSPVRFGMPREIMELMKLYPQPIQQSGVEFLPIDVPRPRRI